MILGSHVSFSKEQLLGSVKEAISYGANTFMFYTGAPQNTIRKEISMELTETAYSLMKENNIELKNIICHAPYIINLANNKDLDKWNFSIEFLNKELSRCDELGVSYLVLHPGSAVGLDRELALNNIVSALNKVLIHNYKCMILIEVMALKGTEIGSLEDVKYILNNVNNFTGVCLDTCHMNDSGIELFNFDELLNQIDEMIGLDHVRCVHLNDSKNTIGTKKDRHANIGYGEIGFDTLSYICHHDKLKEVPKILETPYIGDSLEDKTRIYPPYRFEIEMLKRKQFNENLLKDIHDYYTK